MKFLLTIALFIASYSSSLSLRAEGLLPIAPTSVLAHSSVQVIKMAPQNFEPNNVTVDENSTIIFVNQDTVPRWPASDFHPTHDLYPEFDTKKAIQPGESWSFKPKKTGAWKYHDHLNPHFRATITVTPDDDGESNNAPFFPLNTIESIKNYFVLLVNKVRSLLVSPPSEIAKPEEFKKLTPNKQFQVLTSFAKTAGANKAWAYITETFKGEAGSSGNIHDIAHLAGKLIYEDKGVAGIGICTTMFAFGCYHGLLDAAFKTSLNDLTQAEKECEKIGPVNSGPYGSCIHGIGHGVASYHQTSDLPAALKSCDFLSSGRNFCYDGVFMEFARNAEPSFYTKDKPFYPCDALEQDYGNTYSLSCGRNQPTVFVSRLGLAFENAIKLCGGNNMSDKFKGSCFDALGFMLASTQDTDKIIAGCKSIANTNYSGLCFKSGAGELIFQDVPGWQEKSRAVCDASPPPARQLCHENRQRLIKEYGRQLFNILQPGQDENEYVRSQMRICYEAGGKDDCYKQVAQLFSEQFGLKKTLELFQKNEVYPEIYARCHETTHYLSRNEYKKTGSIASVYDQCDSTCHGGCYHGVLEQHIKEKNLALAGLYKEFPKVCGKLQDFSSPLVFNECLHGLGHAAMFVRDMEVPESLSLCEALEVQEAKERCWSGVFMENSSSSTNSDHPGRWVKKDDPLFPCNALPEKYSKLCYRYQSSHFALITNHNWTETANLCLKVSQNYQDECFRTIGTNQVGFTQNPSLMRKNCSLMPNAHFEEICLQGVISSFAYRFVGDDTLMTNFCSGVSANYQEGCFKQMGTSVIDWSPDKKQAVALCEQITNAQFSSWCKNGINNFVSDEIN